MTADKPDAAWKAELSAAAYNVLRCHGTEAPFSHPLNFETRDGIYVCAGCGAHLFDASVKFDSGTGWPSFYDALKDSLAETIDHSHGMTRVEYSCAKCGGHQGHIFTDGPAPTGLRYCNNGTALRFIPKETP